MPEPVNLQQAVDSVFELFRYLPSGTLKDHVPHVLQTVNRVPDF